MPAIVPPRLDDRSWQELRDELVRRIPVHDPSWTWTDHNPSDPGVALLEVFAWLAENLLRRMDRVPDKAQLQFLQLLGAPPRAATVARARVRLDLPKGAIEPVVAPFSPADPRLQLAAGKLRFSALGEIEVLPVEGRPTVKRAVDAGAIDPDEAVRVGDTLKEHLALEEDPELLPYEGVVLPAPVGGALPDAVELSDTIDDTLWIGLLAPEDALKTHTREEVRDRLAGAVLNVGVWIDEALAEGEVLACGPAEGDGEMRWELSTGGFLGATKVLTEVRWKRVALVDDTTGGLLRSGVVRVLLPDDPAEIDTWRNLADPDGRPVDGMGDLPPAIDDEETNARAIAWLRAVRTGGPARRVRFVDVNVVEVEHAVAAGRELLGSGAGRAGQTVKLSRTPVLPESVLLEVREQTAGWVRWTLVPDLALSRADDPHFLLDPITGEVRFGDGVHGRMPRIGEAIRVQTYRWGGGAAGNVAASALTKVAEPATASSLRATQLLPAGGGADGETVEEARVNLPRVLRHNDRAVAAEDFRDLALATPGAGVGRVQTLPRHLPDGHVDEVPGVVSLVVLPAWDPEHPDEPVPDKELLRKVCAWLEPRRLCTTELYLLAPEYVPVWVSVAVAVKEGYGLQTVKRWVELAVRQVLAPLPPYGPAGEGWPFGRTVRAADIEAAVVAVEGVEIVTDLILRGIAIGRDGARRAVATVDPCDPQDVPMLAWQLPAAKDVRVAVGETAEPLDDEPAPSEAPQGWPVPAARETC